MRIWEWTGSKAGRESSRLISDRSALGKYLSRQIGVMISDILCHILGKPVRHTKGICGFFIWKFDFREKKGRKGRRELIQFYGEGSAV